MLKIFKLVLIIIGLIFVQGTVLAKTVKPKDLKYKGAFRLPAGTSDEEGPKTWSWGGRYATYYPHGNPDKTEGYKGSLFATSHNQYQYISEISIPKPSNSRNKKLSKLPVAKTLQGFENIRGNRMGDLELPIFALGYLPKQEGQDSAKLYYGWGEHQQENQRKASQGLFDTDLSSPDVKGPWKLGNRRNYVTTGYIYNIPKKWANKYAGGKRLIAGRYRDGGQGTQGPSAIAYAPWKKGTMPKKGSKLSSKALLKYSSVYNDPDGEHAMNNYAHSDQWAGGAWIKTGDKQAMIFVGIKGKGDCWYGYRDGTVWPEEPPYPDEGPGERGWWSEDFEAQILFYRAKDLRKVAKGKKPTWWPQPYAVKRIESKMFYKPKTELRYIGGVAFDRKRGRLYVFEYLGDQNNNRPLVHVWKMKK